MNREPKINLKDHQESNVRGIASRKGVYAVLYSVGDKPKVVRAKKDGSISEYYLEGTATLVFDPRIAVAPNGDIYVAATIRDSFKKQYLAYYKISSDGKVTENLIEENSIGRPNITVSDAGDV